MVPDYPQDSDGDALRRVARDGSDMGRPMLIDYHVAVADAERGETIAEKAKRLGYRTRVVKDHDRDAFTVWCSRSMVPDYDSVLECQRELDAIAASHGGKTDGWGTHGNVDQ